MEKDPEYYEFDRLEMVKFLPTHINKSIEFGCSSGKFSYNIKTKYNAEVWGVDMDPESIKKADENLDRTILSDAVSSLNELPKSYFDCVICNDFLEHLYEPEEFLQALKPYLANGAHLVCSLPNVRYWKNIGELLFDKDWRYREGGILDSTHFRFFTKKSMLRLMNNCDLVVEEITGINPTKSLRFQLINLLTLGQHSDSKYMQYGIRARFN